MRTIRPTRCWKFLSMKVTRLPTRKSVRPATSGGGAGLVSSTSADVGARRRSRLSEDQLGRAQQLVYHRRRVATRIRADVQVILAQYLSQCAAIESIAGRIGCTAETLRK